MGNNGRGVACFLAPETCFSPRRAGLVSGICFLEFVSWNLVPEIWFLFFGS